MAFSFSGGYTALTAFSALAQAVDDWSGGASVTGISNSASQSGDPSVDNFATPNWTGDAVKTRAPVFSASVNTVGIVNASAFGTVNHSASRRVLIAHFKYFSTSQITAASYLDTIGNGAVTVTWFSGTGYSNFVRLTVGGKDVSPLPTAHVPVVWKPGYTTGAFSTGGTFDNTNVQHVAVHSKPGATLTATMYITTTNCGYVDPYIATGTDADPMGSFYTKARTTDQCVVVERLAASQYLVRCALTWGNGSSTATKPQDTTARSIFWPDAPTSIRKETFVSNDWIGFEFNAGRNDDTTGHTAAYSFTFPQPMYFRLVYGDGVAPTVAGLLKFTGWIVTGASSVVISKEWNIASFIFNSCGAVDLTSGAVTLTGTTTINGGTGAVQMYCDDFTNVSTLVFTGAGNTTNKTCLRIAGGTRTITMPPVYSDGSQTYHVEYTGSGTLTLNQNAAGDTLTAHATGGGTVVIASAATWTLKHTGLANGTRYRIVDSIAGELYNTTVSGTGFSFTDTSLTAGRTLTLYTTYQSGTTVKWGGPWPLTVPSGGGSLDWSANTPTTQGAFAAWGVDGSTVTECSSDYVNIQVDISTGASTMARERILAFIAYALTSANGIRNWFSSAGPILTINDAANVVVNAAVAGLTIVNVGGTAVLLTNLALWIRRSDNAALLVNGTSSLTMEVSPVYVISAGSGLTASEHNQLMAIPTNIATASSLAAVDTKVTDMHRDSGLDVANPVTITPTSRTSGTMALSISNVPGVRTTLTRTA